ncbi:MAG TPA: F0F1 ATP synthase subunit B [Acidimicrobiales bacterium]|nr:F0F1 ATP synthase subunit B [Acidimicrobiales bacterium]
MTSSIFLIPNATLIVEVVAFLVVLGFLSRYVLPRVNQAMSDRQDQIRQSLEAAEQAKAEADETRAERQGILEEARQQARQIVTQANTSAERVRAEAAERGQQEYERLVASAESEIALARQRAIEEVSGRVAGLVMSVAEQVIGREVDAEAHRALIDEAVAALRASADTSAAGAPS